MHGTCTDGVDSHTCDCDAGYEGVNCVTGRLIASIAIKIKQYRISFRIFSVKCFSLVVKRSFKNTYSIKQMSKGEHNILQIMK